MADFVFPEDAGTGGYASGSGDANDAANFAAAFGAIGLSDGVMDGMGFTYNSGGPDVDIAAGTAVLSDTSATATQSSETRDNVSFIAQIDARSTVSLSAGSLNYIYLDVDLSTDDTASIVTNTTGSPPASPSLLLGTIDTSSDTVDELNRNIGAAHYATASASGDGTTTTFTLEHGRSTTPTVAFVMPTSSPASTDFYKSNLTSSAVEITYAAAPANGDSLNFDIITV
jgi:hypothetical protein